MSLLKCLRQRYDYASLAAAQDSCCKVYVSLMLMSAYGTKRTFPVTIKPNLQKA